ncbi:MAG TPA: hypothetical protein PKW26_01930 [Treponemataceae bacterium]|nr:hypothetical protein [Treponemataceae bacterium]HOQ92360.1 hypothetical protein [Treponemataceae bacterium]
MKKIIIGVFSVFLLFSFISCDFFVTSWGSGMQRDLSTALKKESAGDLAKLAKDPQFQDPSSGVAVLNALSGKSEADIQALSVSEQESIMDLALAVSIPTSVVTELADIAQDPDNAEPEELFNTILGGINSFDTTVLQAILNDEDALESASPESLVSASLALVAQVMKREGENLNFDDLADLFNDDNDGVDISPESKADIEAVKAVLDLFDEGGKRSDEELTLFGLSLEDYLKVKNEKI